MVRDRSGSRWGFDSSRRKSKYSHNCPDYAKDRSDYSRGHVYPLGANSDNWNRSNSTRRDPDSNHRCFESTRNPDRFEIRQSHSDLPRRHSRRAHSDFRQDELHNPWYQSEHHGSRTEKHSSHSEPRRSQSDLFQDHARIRRNPAVLPRNPLVLHQDPPNLPRNELGFPQGQRRLDTTGIILKCICIELLIKSLNLTFSIGSDLIFRDGRLAMKPPQCI